MTRSRAADRPAHHHPRGGFRNPWPTPRRGAADLLRWQRQRTVASLPPNPPPSALPVVAHGMATPAAYGSEMRITWMGQSTFLVQVAGVNVLTDPQWSDRASPWQFIGPRRFVEAGVAFEELPPIDAVLVSHDHYDHLDVPTIRRLLRRFGDRIEWFTPLGYAPLMARLGVRRLVELDWWECATLTDHFDVEITAFPARHWTSRVPWSRGQRLWASWGVRGAGMPAVYFAGDTGYFPEFAGIGERLGPLAAALLPIGAYEPQWFMQPVHMNPDEAIAAWRDLGGSGHFCAMHWGTWRLTDEDPLEPPRRLRESWRAAGLPADLLWVARHGETLRFDAAAVADVR